MIIEQDVLEALEHMRQIGADTQHWEVKEAVVDLPKSLLDTISAFSNMHGGTIILGVSEKMVFIQPRVLMLIKLIRSYRLSVIV